MPKTTLERLRKNDPTLSKLKLVSHHEEYTTNFSDLLQCLRSNTTVKYVLMERHFVRHLSKDQWIAVLQAVGQMTSVEEVEIWLVRVPLKELCEAFSHSTKLKRLGFGFVTLVGSLDATALCEHQSLQTFYLSDFRLSDETASLNSLCHALSTCPRLEFLEVFQYQQETAPFSAAGLATLLDSSSLQHLTLRRMGLTAELTSDLAHALSTNISLCTLSLNENNLGNAGCAAIGEALKVNNSLLELNLRKNQLSAAGCFRLSQLLNQNGGLEKLNLACNPLEDVGAQGLALLLQVHSSLKTLELHRTEVSDVGCVCLVETLRHNTKLVHLDLSFNQITELTYLQVAQALKRNRTLKSINLQVNRKLKAHACEALLGMLHENTVLEQISTLMRVRFVHAEYDRVKQVLDQMTLYLRLNHAGRRSLLQGDATVKEWGSCLLKVQDDLNGVFYLAQANPVMVCRPFVTS